MRATSRIADVSLNTVSKLLVQIGSYCIWHHNTYVRNITSQIVQCDEIWSFVYAKERNVPQDMRGKGVGDAWTWVAIDIETKLIISWHVGNRELEDAMIFMQDLRMRVANRIQLTSDRLGVYPAAVEQTFGWNGIDYAQLSKSYGSDPETERKYSPRRLRQTDKITVFGFPDHEYISTSMVERQNLTIRTNIRRFTRLTNGYSKKLMYHKYAVALHFVYYNFCRIHSTIRVTPAMEAGLVTDILEIEDLIKLADE